jgi:hypothetical protein
LSRILQLGFCIQLNHLKDVFMLPWLNRWLDKKCQAYFIAKQPEVIAHTLQVYALQHRVDVENDHINQVNLLKDKLCHEARRLYPMVNRSILRATITSSSMIFWFTLGISIPAAICLKKVSSLTSWSIYIAPIIASATTWTYSMGRGMIQYEERIAGGMDSVMCLFEFDRQQNHVEIAPQISPSVAIVPNSAVPQTSLDQRYIIDAFEPLFADIENPMQNENQSAPPLTSLHQSNLLSQSLYRLTRLRVSEHVSLSLPVMLQR